MSTRSDIIAKCSDGTWARIYCHFDGYLSGVGAMLLANYTTQEKVDGLMALGDISVLEASIEKPDGHLFDLPVAGHTIAYGRDRGESNTEAIVDQALEPLLGGLNEYTYVGEDGAWRVLEGSENGQPVWLELAQAVEADRLANAAS